MTVVAASGQVNFSCEASRAAAMVESSVDELVLLRDSGPSPEDVSAAVEMSQREHEEVQGEPRVL